MKKKDATEEKKVINNEEKVIEGEENRTQDQIDEGNDSAADDSRADPAKCVFDQEDKLKKSLQEKAGECEKLYTLLQRTAADFDNYKKRTLKEKETIFTDTAADVAAAFLPVADNLERALGSVTDNANPEKIRGGISLVIKQMYEILDDLKVKEIEALGKKFDPLLHNAVLHVDDEKYGENEIIEVMQKGYILNGKVIRYSMVKVAN